MCPGQLSPGPGLTWDDEKFYIGVIAAGSLLIWILVIFVIIGVPA